MRSLAQRGRRCFSQAVNERLSNVLDDQTVVNATIAESDAEINEIMRNEYVRQKQSLTLIPSENFTSVAVLEALGSCMQNKYSEGYPGQRYYGGNDFIDQAETLCQKRALEAYGLDPEKWGVNVQPLSGSPANFEAYTACLEPKDRIMSLELTCGGHLSHGFQTPTKKISAVSKYFEVFQYRLDESTGRINYDDMYELALRYNPKLIVGGGSAYARWWDYEKMRKTCDAVNAIYLFDMAHVSGLVAAGVHPSPFEYADIVTTTTHKSLRGPRGSMIFYRKGQKGVTKKGTPIMYKFEDAINQSVFPGHQGGPHNHTITALAVALKQTQTPAFKAYQQRVVENMAGLAKYLIDRGYDLVSGGTDNHLALVDLKSKGVKGAQVERVCELANISLNKNTVPGDKSALMPSGIRLGTPAMTTRGFDLEDFTKVAKYLDRAVVIAKTVQDKAGSAKVKDFQATLAGNDFPEINELKEEVAAFADGFPFMVPPHLQN